MTNDGDAEYEEDKNGEDDSGDSVRNADGWHIIAFHWHVIAFQWHVVAFQWHVIAVQWHLIA